MTPRETTALLLQIAEIHARVARYEAGRMESRTVGDRLSVSAAWIRVDGWEVECERLRRELAAMAPDELEHYPNSPAHPDAS